MSEPVSRGKRGEIDAVHGALRAFSSQMAWHSQAVAAAAGMHSTDLEVLDLLDQHGDLTAGRLAELTGLTTGAVTGVIDRLEAAGHVTRLRDAQDRRRITVRKTERNNEDMGELYGPVSRSLDALLTRYDSHQLEAIADYAERAATALAQDAARIRQMMHERAASDAADVSIVAGAELGVLPRSATLLAERGLSKAAITVGSGFAGLARGRFWRSPPTFRDEGDTLVLAYRRSVFGSIAMGSAIELNGSPLWAFDIRQGVSYSTFDLSNAVVSAIRIDGGIKAVEFTMGRPTGVVPVVLDGGASEVAIVVPTGAAASVRFDGGVSRAVVGAEKLKSSAGVRAEIGRGDAAKDRYDIVFTGGTTKVTIAAAARR
jgi:DNA-binding MarR family transcriptional regulator